MTKQSLFILIYAIALCVSLFTLSGCKRTQQQYHGYVEGDLTYIASPISGQLTAMPVLRGDPVHLGDLLFKLDQQPEFAQMQQAVATVKQFQATLTDLSKGERPSELAAIQAQIDSAIAQVDYSKIIIKRRQELVKQVGLQQEQLDKAVEDLATTQATLKQVQANLVTAKLSSRIDQIIAARDQVTANIASLQAAEWRFQQKTVSAPVNATVFDRYYYIGEQVPADQPVLSLLDPNNIKAVFFVPETDLANIYVGQKVTISCDGCEPLPATIRFISPQAEFTPPIIYSQDTRTKLRYRIEAFFRIKDRTRMHPGQPIDINVSFTALPAVPATSLRTRALYPSPSLRTRASPPSSLRARARVKQSSPIVLQGMGLDCFAFATLTLAMTRWPFATHTLAMTQWLDRGQGLFCA